VIFKIDRLLISPRFQTRFYLNTELSSNESWWIPLTYATSSNPSVANTTAQMWFDPETSETVMTIDVNDQWYILNKQHCGYYRVMYDIENWKNLANALMDDSTILPPLNKAQLINDAFVFGQSWRLVRNNSRVISIQLQSV
jgi:aminopeptidase N